ncbi:MULTISPECIES: cell division protein FtsQ/DivIB [unclassified Nitrobacter]|uniref:cell division protein FtsQ/DivIB n=1 Tax=unclassified Nitrobacter TaxID=2620411 RepID=UPI000925AC13|nr:MULTISPECIES: cell division protein FtsQ/DivIB [unclassified Nitrobacter]MBN9148332.1 cell division protein FtsQ/DivIB [Nitrobacter sp.]OJU99736.1 MAG: cell division protein FtsQ [Nitrobacter sp. 62-23]
MKGGGRLDRSLRSPGSISDLSGSGLLKQVDLIRLAAAGAGILLREQVAKLKRARAERLDARARNPNRAIAFLERYVPRRLGMALTVTVLGGSAALGVITGGHVDAAIGALSDARNALANAAGFRISSVTVNGRKQLTQDEVLAAGGVNGRSSLLFLDAAGVRDSLKADPWVADATVLKLYPGALQIDITERRPFALWQEDGKLSVIADDGVVLEPYVTRRFASLPLVVGKGAETRARDFLALVAQYPVVNNQLKAAILVGERRWNLRLKDGLDIRLPENDVGRALAALVKYDMEDRLLSRDITAIDMRLPDRMTVRLSEEAAKAREEQFKKSSKKAGSA